MSVANLINPPQSDKDIQTFSFANQDHHNRVSIAIKQAGGATITPQEVDPIAFFDFERWLERHQQWHNDINSGLGLAGFDLSDLDFKNPKQLNAWVSLHFREHQQWEQATGVG